MKMRVKIMSIELVIALVFCFFYWNFSFTQTEVTYDNVQTMLENEETFTLMVVKEDCSYCEALKDYIKTSKLTHPFHTVYVCKYEGYTNFPKKLGIVKYTPTIYKIKNGEVVATAVGFSTKKGNVYIDDGYTSFENLKKKNFWKFLDGK